MESSYDEEEANTYIMENHRDDKVTSYFSYHDFFHICKCNGVFFTL